MCPASRYEKLFRLDDFDTPDYPLQDTRFVFIWILLYVPQNTATVVVLLVERNVQSCAI